MLDWLLNLLAQLLNLRAFLWLLDWLLNLLAQLLNLRAFLRLLDWLLNLLTRLLNLRAFLWLLDVLLLWNLLALRLSGLRLFVLDRRGLTNRHADGSRDRRINNAGILRSLHRNAWLD